MDRRICEFQPLPLDAALTRHLDERRLEWSGISLSALTNSHGDLAVECAPFLRSDTGHWHASRWIGAFAVDGQTWQIIPRIGEHRFARIATSALSAMLVSGAIPAGDVNRSTLLDLLPLAWFVAFRAGLRNNGLPRAYIQREAADCPELRGTLDLETQLTENQIRRHHLACRWADLTLDNPINRGTRMVIDHLRKTRRFPYCSRKTRVAAEMEFWRERLPLVGVSATHTFPVEKVRWSRANDGFRSAHRLARYVLQDRGISTTGACVTKSLFIDSAEVWELYLRQRLEAVVAHQFPEFRTEWPRASAKPDALLEWNGRRVRQLIPDFHLVRRTDQKRVLVVDAKYREFRPLHEDREVAQQMALYAATANQGHQFAPPCILLYPRAVPTFGSPGLNASRERLLGRGNFFLPNLPAIEAWSVDLPDATADIPFDLTVDAQLRSILETFLGRSHEN